jgi:hypothetical protein
MFATRQAISWIVDYIPPFFGRLVVTLLPWPKLQHARRLVNNLMEMSESICASHKIRDLQDHLCRDVISVLGMYVCIIYATLSYCEPSSVCHNEQLPQQERLSADEIKGQIALVSFQSNGLY